MFIFRHMRNKQQCINARYSIENTSELKILKKRVIEISNWSKFLLRIYTFCCIISFNAFLFTKVFLFYISTFPISRRSNKIAISKNKTMSGFLSVLEKFIGCSISASTKIIITPVLKINIVK